MDSSKTTSTQGLKTFIVNHSDAGKNRVGCQFLLWQDYLTVNFLN